MVINLLNSLLNFYAIIENLKYLCYCKLFFTNKLHEFI